MSTIKLHGRTFKLKISHQEIISAVTDIANLINEDLKGKKPLFLAVLNGSFMFAADLMKKINIECELSFVKLASYEGTSSSGSVKQLIGLNEDIRNRTVVVIEDIVDTGLTIESVWNQLHSLGATEVRIASLLFKPDAYIKTIPLAYTAIVASNDFIVGYGLDYNGLGRNLDSIYVLDYDAPENKI